MVTSNKYFCLILLIFLGSFVLRIFLLNLDAQYFFSDESRYDDLVIGWKQTLENHNPMIYLNTIFNIQARPGYAILYALPAYFEQKWNFFPFGIILNTVVSSLNIILVFLIVHRLQGYKAALLAALLIFFSTTSVVYMRHMLPYDLGLLFLLVSFYIYLTTRSFILTGVLLAITHLIYPSYFYYYLPIPIFFLLGRKEITQFKFIAFIIGFSLPIFTAEVISKSLGIRSYLETAKALSGTVTQGDFLPFAAFLGEYVQINDGLFGIFTILFIIFMSLFRQVRIKFGPLLLYLLALFLVFEIFTHVFHITVMYGRTIRPFYWLLLASVAMFIVYAVKRFKSALQMWIYALIIITVISNATPRLFIFKDLVYPTEFRQETANLLHETITTNNKTDKYGETIYFTLEPGELYLVNADSIYPYFGSKRLICNKQIIIEKPHIQAVFKPYLFEGFSKKMREYIEKDPPKYQLLHCI